MIVLDSHVWFWWINLEHRRLSAFQLENIETADQVGVSAVPVLSWLWRTAGGVWLCLASRVNGLRWPWRVPRWICFR